MIKKSCFKALKDELSRASFVFEKRGSDINLQCKGHSDVQEFKRHLANLHIEFVAEVHDNLSNLSTRQEVDFYFGMLLNAFELLKDLIGSYIEFEYMSANGKSELNQIPDSGCIYFKPIEIAQMKQCFQYQKSIIEKSIDLVSCFKKKIEMSSADVSVDQNSTMCDMIEFAPYLSKIREVLSEQRGERKQIKFLKNQRKKLAIVFVAKGIDIYNSAVNVWFEARIEAYKEAILKRKNKQKTKKPSLIWLGSKNDFLELMMSFDQIKAIGDCNRNPISRKELILHFSKEFNIQQILDSESRITKLMSRNNPTAFLDRLRDKMKSLKNKKGF